MIPFLVEKLRRAIWLFAVKHCRPCAFSLDKPQLVFASEEKRWTFVTLKDKAFVLLPSRAEAIPLSPFIVDALAYLNANPCLIEKTIHERLGDHVRGKDLLRKLERVA